MRGPAALEAHAARLRAAFPDARLETTGPRMTAGRHVAAPVRVLGTHRGPIGDDALPPTGQRIVVHAVLVCELAAGADVLWRVRAFLDAYAAGLQLGALPPRGSVSERALLMLRGFGLRSRT